MPDIVINPSLGKIDFFTVKGEQVTNSMRLGDASTILFTGALSASSITTGGGGAFVTSVQPTANYLSKFTGNSTIANSLVYDNGTNVGIGTTAPTSKLHIYTTGTNDGIILDGSSNPVFVHRTSGTDRTYLATVTSAGSFFTDANQYDFLIRSQTNNILFGRGSGTSTMAVVGSNVGIGTTVPSASLHINSTTAGATLLRTDGTNGTLFSVVDDLSDSLMSVNNSAGLPVLEVFTDDRIVAGQYGQNDFVVINNKVGIGTNNPPFKLYVTGSLGVNASSLDTNWPFVVSDNSSAGSRYGLNKAGSMGFNNADNYAQLQLVGTNGAYLDLTNSVGGDSNARLIYYAGSRLELTYGFTTTITLNSTGVGIGTTVPSGELHIYGAQPAFRIQSSVSGSMQFGQWDGTYNRIQSSARDFLLISTDATNLIFSTNTTERLRISGSGNVGIGTTSPASLLHLQSSAATTLLRIDNTNAENDAAILLTDNNSPTGEGLRITYDSSVGDTYFNNIYTDSTRAFSFQKGSFGSGTDLLTILTNGNVGIGTTSPASKLHVSGSGQTVIRVEASTTTNVAVFAAKADTDAALIMGMYGGSGVGNQFGVSAARQAFIGTTSYSTVHPTSLVIGNVSNIPIAFGTDNTERMRIASDGNVGIGTTSPVALLNIRASAPTTTGGVTTGTNLLIDSNTSNYITFRNTADNGTYAGLVFLDNNVGGYITFRNYTASGVAVGSDCMIYGSYQDHIFQSGVSETINGKTETMRIQQNGYVGINTNNPTGRLHVVQGNSGGVAAILLSSDESTIQGPSANTQIRMGSNLVLAASGIIPIDTNGSERMRITSTGCVGIGTTSVRSNSLLDVYGAGVFGTSGYGFYVGTDATGAFLDAGTQLMRMFAGQQERMRIATDGNVGIGTTTSAAKLHVASTTAAATLLRADGTSGTLFSVVDDLSDSLMSVNNSAGLPVLEVFADDRIVGGQYGQNDLVVVNNKVGIGTNNPLAKLHVTGSASVPAAVFLGDVGIGTTAPTAQSNYRFLQVNGPTSAIIETTVGGTRIGGFDSTSNTLYVGSIGSFPVVFRTAVDEKMRISANGNVGIGTTNPSTKLDVYTNGANNYISNRSDGADGSIQGITFVGGVYNRAIISSVNESTNGGYLTFQTYTGGNGAEVMRITATGNVLVGRTSAGLTNATGVTISQSSIGMQTEGNAVQIVMNRTTSDGNIVEIRRNNIAVGTISVTTTATAYNTTSDYRLKQSVKLISDGLSRINSLRPSIYKWKSDGSNGEGFLAHELAEVVPIAVTGQKDAVNDDGSINPQSVDLSKVVPILVAAIQELSAKVKTLEAKVQILESK